MKVSSVALAIVLSLCLLCGCKENKPSAEKDTNATQSQAVTEDSNKTQAEIKGDDLKDPQNTESSRGEGAPVQIENVKDGTGKALGIDVSKWQGKIDWQRVKNAGINFAIIRIGYRAENGVIYKDANADYNIQQANKAGILIGVYFFSTAINSDEAVKEAKWVESMIESYPISYPVVYDCEGFLSSQSRMYALSKEQRTQNAVAFLSHIKNIGYDAMFYGAKTDLEGHWNMPSIEKSYKVWVAHYPSVTYPKIAVPDYAGRTDMWQYTNKGSVDGIKGNVDMVVSYFISQKSEPKSNKSVETAKPPEEKDNIYTAVNETVTAKDTVNLREGAGTNHNIVGTLKNGERLTRTATGTNGWSKLLYKGKTVYAITSYLTTDLGYKPPTETDKTYTAVNEQVTAKTETNLRTAATTNGSQVVHTLKNGEKVTRTGVGSNGWSRLLYNGQTVYAITSYLTTDLGYKPPVQSEPQTNNNQMQFSDVNEQVTAKSETNLRTAPTTSGSQVVYTLKNGEYIIRTGVSDSGWSRLNYNGQTVYAVSSYLTN